MLTGGVVCLRLPLRCLLYRSPCPSTTTRCTLKASATPPPASPLPRLVPLWFSLATRGFSHMSAWTDHGHLAQEITASVACADHHLDVEDPDALPGGVDGEGMGALDDTVANQ